MAGLEQYIPPNLRRGVRELRGMGTSLLDNVIGLDDGYDSAGERFKRQFRADPSGMAKQIGGGILSGVANAVTSPIDTAKGAVQSVGQSMVRAGRGADAYLPEGVTLQNATPVQIRAANDAFTADMLGGVGVAIPAVGPALKGAAAAGRLAGNIDTGALTADAIGAGRAITSGDMGLLGEVLQRGGEGQSLSAARSAGPMTMLGSDYFEAPREGGGRAKDPAMFTPFSMTKQKNAPYEWSAKGNFLGQNQIPDVVSPSTQQGNRIFFAAGDRTAGDVELTNVGKLKLRRPVKLNAGAEYMDTGEAWASHKGVMVPKQNVLLPSFEAGQNPQLAFMPMGERSGDFAKHQGELYAEMLFSSKMPRATVSAVNDQMKRIVLAQAEKDLTRTNNARVKKGLKPLLKAKSVKVPSVTSDGFRDWFSKQSPEGVRKPFLMAMDGSTPKALEGVPDVGEARFATTNPDLVTSETNSGGFRFVTPDVSRGLLPASHPTYDTKLASVEGTGGSTYGYQIPWTILARDTALPRLAEAAREKGQFYDGQNMLFGGRRTTLPSEQRVFTMNPKTSQLADQQYVDEASTYGEVLQRQGKEGADRYEMGLIDAFIRGR